jgi:hypothetical protein
VVEGLTAAPQSAATEAARNRSFPRERKGRAVRQAARPLVYQMSFTYDFNSNPTVAYIRLLVSDTVNVVSSPVASTDQPCIFQDEEIMAFYTIQQLQFQSSMQWSWPQGKNLPSSPVSMLRVAALALDAMASNQALLSTVTKLMDVTLSPSQAAVQLRAQAASYRQTDDEAGAFAIIEQCTTVWGTRDRYWNQVMRQSGGGI